MSFTALTTFVEFQVGSAFTYYQNGTVGSTPVFNGRSHKYLSFIYQGAAKNRNGNNLEAALLLSANQLSLNEVRRGIAEKAKVAVTTCIMSDDFSTVTQALTEERWLVTSMSYDTETIEVQLSSAIDAVGLVTPNRVLTRNLVGDLPVTAQIFNR